MDREHRWSEKSFSKKKWDWSRELNEVKKGHVETSEKSIPDKENYACKDFEMDLAWWS